MKCGDTRTILVQGLSITTFCGCAKNWKQNLPAPSTSIRFITLVTSSCPKFLYSILHETKEMAMSKLVGFPAVMPQKKRLKNVKFNFLQKQTSRREMLRGSATLAGSAFLAHLFPAALLRASAAGDAQQASSPAEL